jgi:phosphatidylglycerol:prolipoprotein diacylglycerol transferase
MVVGGRLGYCLLYAGDAFWKDPIYLFRIYEGGMASHGGIAGMAAGVVLFCRRRRRNLGALCDQVAALAPLGVIFGRLANFVNGELWGRPGDVSWAVYFPKAPPVDPARYPWVESLACPTVAEPASWVEWVGRLPAEWCFAPRHPSQLYAVVLEGLLPFVLLYFIHTRHRRPWLTVAWCFILYGLGRFVGEFWREPDEGYELFFGWMSKGQLFTIPVFLIGIALIVWTRRGAPRPAVYEAPPAPARPPEVKR